MTPETEQQDCYDRQVQRIKEHYEKLEELAEKTHPPVVERLLDWLNPFYDLREPKKKGLFADLFYKYKKNVCFRLMTPLRRIPPDTGIDDDGNPVGALYFVLALILIGVYFFAIRDTVYGARPTPTESVSLPDIIVFTALFVFPLPALYIRLWFFIRNKPRMRWHPVLLGLYFGIVFLAITLPLWPAGPMKSSEVFSALRVLWNEIVRHKTFDSLIFYLLIYFIPGFTFVFTNLIDGIAWIIVYIAKGAGVFDFLHNPRPNERIQKLATTTISGEKEQWSLKELSLSEIRALKEWVAANRESSDKRLLPTVIVLSIIQVVGASTIFGNIRLSDIFNFLISGFSEAKRPGSYELSIFFLKGILLAFAASLFVFPMIAIFVLLKNMATKSLLLETCIVAEYAKEQKEREDRERLEKEKRVERNDSIIDKLLSVFHG